MNVSVCMAVYNGEKYIRAQINSILNILEKGDELIIIDDVSVDNSVERIKEFSDQRIKLFINDKNLGHVATFSKALSLSNYELIFLSDQDDIWYVNKIDIVKNIFLKTNKFLYTTNFNFIDEFDKIINLEINQLKSINSDKYIRNITSIFTGNIPYYGCAMTVNKKLLNLVLPIPKYVESHDLWIALAANLSKSNQHFDESTFSRRLHSNNVSSNNRPAIKKIKSRVIFARAIIHIIFRIVRIKINKL